MPSAMEEAVRQMADGRINTSKRARRFQSAIAVYAHLDDLGLIREAHV